MLTTTALSVLAWMSLSLTATHRLKTNYAVGLLVTACLIILVLFVGMILGFLSVAYYAIILGAFLEAVLRGWTPSSLKDKLKAKKPTLQDFWDSYLFLYVTALVAIIIFLSKVYPDFKFFGWDEFSHWARYTNILVNTSIAPVDNPAVLFPAYPPGINLWHYYICGPNGYSEWKVVFSHMLLAVSAIAFISTSFDKLKGFGPIAIFVFGIMLYHAFGTSLYEIYTDCILGLLFGASLLVARTMAIDGPNKSNMAIFIIILAVISLIKPIAILFSVTACGLFFGLRLIVLLQDRFRKTKTSDPVNGSPIRLGATLIQTGIYVAASLSTVLAWKIYTSIHSIKDQLADSQKIGMSEVIEFVFTRETPETQIAWKELGDRIGLERISTYGGKQFRLDADYFNPDIPIYHGAIALLLATLGFFLLRLIFNHKKALTTFAEGLYLAITFLLYTMVIVFITRYFFQLYDIERLASLERYLSSFLLGIMLYGLATLIADISELKNQTNVKKYTTLKNINIGKIQDINVLSFIFPALWIWLSFYIAALGPVDMDNVFASPMNERPVPGVHPWADEYNELSELRDHIATLSNTVKSKAKAGDRVYIIAQNETGFTFYMTGHELSPLETNRSCFSIGLKYYETDNWTCEWVDLSISLLDYDYVVIRYADKVFWDRFGSIFEESAYGSRSGVFKVEKDADNTIKVKTIYLSDQARGPDSPT